MKSNMRIVGLGFLLIAIASCSQLKNENEADKKPFSILLGNFKNYEHALKFKSSLDNIVKQDLRLEYISNNNYAYLYGSYKSSFEAGEAAFELFSNSLIVDYDIVRKEKKVLDLFSNVLFVANYMGNASVFSYNLTSKRIELIWSRSIKKVLYLNLTEGAESAFITTAFSLDQRPGIPYIRDAAVFFLDREKDASEEILSLGDCLQIYTYWEPSDSFKINVTTTDLVTPEIILQEIHSFDKSGRHGAKKKRTFDLLKDGFPAAPKRIPIYFSPDNRFRLRATDENGELYFYLKDFQEKSEMLVGSSNNKIKDARWSEDSNFLFIITEDSFINGSKNKKRSKGKLIIVDTKLKKQNRIFYADKYENLLVRGKLLFFDEELNGAQRIVVYDLNRDKIYDIISMIGGCGLNSLFN